MTTTAPFSLLAMAGAYSVARPGLQSRRSRVGDTPAMPTVLAVVGARPNFVKMAPVTQALAEREGVDVRLLHTGQHYDRALSDGFIERLGMPQPDANLGVGSGSHAEQTAKVMLGVEGDLQDHPADLVLVAGDVNSTLAAALAATKLNVAVAHLESGLRSRDWSMPEEVNRIATDRVSDLLLCTSEDAVENLAAEGMSSGVELVGNTMIDSLFRILEDADRPAALAAAGRRAARLRPGHAPPPRAGGRPRGAGGGDRGAGRDIGDRRRSCFPPTRAPSATSRSGGSSCPPGVRLAETHGLRRLHRARGRGAPGDHRLGRRAGGDLGAGRPVPDLQARRPSGP